MSPITQADCGNDAQENVYEKWLRRRLDYAIIRETGNHAAPGFVHTMLHSGRSLNAVASEVREEMWKNNNYPNTNFFQHGQVLYNYPQYMQELLDLRFKNTSLQKERNQLNSSREGKRYPLSMREIATVPKWIGPLIINTCPYPHTLETPLTWTLGKQPAFREIKYSANPARINFPVYPECCRRSDNTCSSIYCREPLPETVYIPGPMMRGEAHFKWHLNQPEVKRNRQSSVHQNSKLRSKAPETCRNPCCF